MADLFDTTRSSREAAAIATRFAVSMVAFNDLTGTGSALAVGCTS